MAPIPPSICPLILALLVESDFEVLVLLVDVSDIPNESAIVSLLIANALSRILIKLESRISVDTRGIGFAKNKRV